MTESKPSLQEIKSFFEDCEQGNSFAVVDFFDRHLGMIDHIEYISIGTSGYAQAKCALSIAMLQGHDALCRILLERGANPAFELGVMVNGERKENSTNTLFLLPNVSPAVATNF